MNIARFFAMSELVLVGHVLNFHLIVLRAERLEQMLRRVLLQNILRDICRL